MAGLKGLWFGNGPRKVDCPKNGVMAVLLSSSNVAVAAVVANGRCWAIANKTGE